MQMYSDFSNFKGKDYVIRCFVDDIFEYRLFFKKTWIF